MVGDLKLSFVDYGQADITVDGRDAVQDEGLETAVIISLFTDSRVTDDDKKEISESITNRGGWWGNELTNDNIGCKAWLLTRSKLTNETMNKFQEYFTASLQWMVTDLIITSAVVTVYREGDGMNLLVQLKKPNNKDIDYRYFYNWQNQILMRSGS